MENFNVLIVDDEVHAIKGIRAGVQWEKLGISKVYSANHLAQAQSVFQNERIDLLLSDIDMPKGSGIDLLRWVREEYPHTEAIFLTCHSEFSYAKEALQLKSLNYLLKPIDYVELEEAIQSARQKIYQDQQIHKVEDSYMHLQQIHQSHQQEQFWLSLVNEMFSSSIDEIKYQLAIHKLTYDDSIHFLPVLTHVYRWKDSFSHRDEKKLTFSLKNAIKEEVAKNDVKAVVIELSSSHFLTIIPKYLKYRNEEISDNCDRLIEKCIRYFGCDLCCYVGKKTPINEIVNTVNCLKDMDRNNVILKNKTLEWDHEHKQQSYIPQIPKMEWIDLMKLGLKDRLIDEINVFIRSWKEADKPLTWETLHIFYQDFLQILFYTLQIKGLDANQVFSRSILMEQPEKILVNVHSLKEWITFIVDVAMDQLHQSKESDSVVDKVKQYVKENIGVHKLTRDEIANYVFLNPDYLTRVFKKQTGMSISDYLQHERIEHAKQLLIKTDMSVSEIALDSGYSNFSYFSTLFKKITKLNPVDFRRQYVGKNGSAI